MLVKVGVNERDFNNFADYAGWLLWPAPVQHRRFSDWQTDVEHLIGNQAQPEAIPYVKYGAAPIVGTSSLPRKGQFDKITDSVIELIERGALCCRDTVSIAASMWMVHLAALKNNWTSASKDRLWVNFSPTLETILDDTFADEKPYWRTYYGSGADTAHIVPPKVKVQFFSAYGLHARTQVQRTCDANAFIAANIDANGWKVDGQQSSILYWPYTQQLDCVAQMRMIIKSIFSCTMMLTWSNKKAGDEHTYGFARGPSDHQQLFNIVNGTLHFYVYLLEVTSPTEEVFEDMDFDDIAWQKDGAVHNSLDDDETDDSTWEIVKRRQLQFATPRDIAFVSNQYRDFLCFVQSHTDVRGDNKGQGCF